MNDNRLNLTALIDSVCGPLAERLRGRRAPSQMRVNPAVFACVQEIRAREIADGYPLMFLGMELTSDPSLAPEGYAFVD